jgi:hypothetical protein
MKYLIFLVIILSLSGKRHRVDAVDLVCLTNEEKLLFELINDYRKSKKLNSIGFSTKLSKVAQFHVRDLMNNYDANDTKCNPHSWSKKGKWSSCCYTPNHNQAKCMWDKPKEIADYSGNGYEIAYYSSDDATAEEGLEGWKKSSGHNPLLVNSGIWAKVEWNAMGVGIYKNYGVVWFGEVVDESEMKVCE